MSGWAKGRVRSASTNKLEADFALELDAQVARGELKWRSRHEPLSIRLGSTPFFYKPDFLVLTAEDMLEIREVKGSHWPMKNKIKTHLVADEFPIPVVIARRPRKAEPWEYQAL